MIDSNAYVQAFYSERLGKTARSLIEHAKKNPLAETKVISTNGAVFSLSKDDEWGGRAEAAARRQCYGLPPRWLVQLISTCSPPFK